MCVYQKEAMMTVDLEKGQRRKVRFNSLFTTHWLVDQLLLFIAIYQQYLIHKKIKKKC